MADKVGRLPPVREIRIIGHRYRVKVVTTLPADTLGHIDTSEQLILLADCLQPDGMKDTLLHEVIHGVHYHFGLDDDSKEEEFTSRTATGLRAVMIDNPELRDWAFS